VTPRAKLRLVGPFELIGRDGEIVSLAGKKIRALIGFLGTEHDRAHSREAMASLLWAETGEERARHNLRQALSKLNRLYVGLVASEGDTLRLDTEEIEVDVADFERLAASDDPDDLSRALTLYRGDLLEGLVVREEGFEDWLRGARARLRDLACEGFQRLAEGLAERGRPEEAIDQLKARLALDPACEQAHRWTMELLASSGRRSDALRQFRICTDALERELGAEPSAETVEVYERIRGAGDESSDAGAVTVSDTRDEASSSEAQPPSIAVLPFDNLSAEEDRYFTDGIAEDILTALSRFGSLTVIARTSSFAYRDREDVPIQKIGAELGTQFIVRGSVRKDASRVRLNVQLMDAPTGRHLWAQRFDREIEDVFLMQDEVTETIVSTLAGRVEAARIARARRMPPERLQAYDYVLRGKDLHHRHTPEDCVRSIEMFERAIERDPDYAVAHAWLACCLGQAMALDIDDREKLLSRAEAEVGRARQLDEDESECHRILAQININRRDLPKARSHQERALFLNPNDDRSVCAMGTILTLWGEAEEGERLVRRSMRLNPYHEEHYWFHLGRALFHLGRDAEALEALDGVTRPKLREWVYRAAAAAGLGEPDLVRREAENLRDQAPGFDPPQYAETVPYRLPRDRDRLLDALTAAGL
jgi:TolB-like protein